MHNQTGLIRRGATYHMRIRVPAALRGALKQKAEITRSLKTKDRKEAERKLHVERVKWDNEFERLLDEQRTAAADPSAPLREVFEVTPKEIEQYRAARIHHLLADDESFRMESADAHENVEGWLSGTYPDEVSTALASGSHAKRLKVIGKEVERMLASDGIRVVDKQSDSYQRLVYAC